MSSSPDSSAVHPAEIREPSFPRLSSRAGGSPVLAAKPRYTNCVPVHVCVCLPFMAGEKL